MNDVVVLLPGITGSVLTRDGHDVWGLSASGMADAIRTLGRNLDTLKLSDDPPDVEELDDGVKATAVFPDVHLIPWLWKIDGYSTLSRRIREEFDVTPGKNFFEFAYDWRRDNRVAGRILKRKTREWLSTWRASGHPNAKLVLLAHSMGGLVSRYFIECLEGWRDTRVLFTFGTPFRGSLRALDSLANGMRKSFAGVSLVDLTALLASFTSVHQLLPTYPCVEGAEGTLVRVVDAKIPKLDGKKVQRALEFHDEIDRAVTENLQDEAYRSPRYLLRPVVGTYQPTFQTAKIVQGKVELSEKHRDQLFDGDGTVPKWSASPRELEGQHVSTFVAAVHGSLQSTEAALVQLVGLLTEVDVTVKLRSGVPPVSLIVDDAYLLAEPIRLEGRCENLTAELTAVVVDARKGKEVARRTMKRTDEGTFSAECAPLPEGTYRVRIEGTYVDDDERRPLNPVSDVFIVSA